MTETMTETMMAAHYRELMGLSEAGTLPDTMDLSGERVEVIWTEARIPGLPAYTLSPNSRVHWAVKAKDAAELKERTIGYCAANHHVSGPVRIFWTVYLAKRGRPRDRDNMLPCLKPAQDGLVARGYIDGDGPNVVVETSVEQVIWSEHRRRPAIRVQIRKAVTGPRAEEESDG